MGREEALAARLAEERGLSANQTRANNVVSGLSGAGDGTLRIFSSIGGQSPSVQVILDVTGYFE